MSLAFISKSLPVIACALLALTAAASRAHAFTFSASGSACVEYGGHFLFRSNGHTYAIHITPLKDAAMPGIKDSEHAIRYTVRRLDENGVYQIIATARTDERKAGSGYIECSDFSLQWSRSTETSGWLYLGSNLPKGIDCYSESVESLDGLNPELPPGKWIAAKAGNRLPPLEPVVVDKAFADPKATCATWLTAVRNGDLDAALACWHYGKNETAAMKVAVGIWIAHRRVEQAAVAKFGGQEGRAALGGWIKPEVSDKALDNAVKRLAASHVTTFYRSAIIEIKGKKPDPEEECFSFPAEPAFRKVEGAWKLKNPQDESDFSEEKFFAPGGWGLAFRDATAAMNETADKLHHGDFNTPADLKAHVVEMEKKISSRFD